MHKQAHICIHTHARAYIHTYVGASARHTHIHITSLCERRRTTNETSIHVYVCTCTYSEYLTNVFYRDFNHFFFFFLFYNTQNFVTARIIGRKCNRDEQASVITVMPYRVPPRKSVIFVSQTHLFFFYSYTFTYIYIYTSTSFFRFRSSSIYVYISPLGYTLPPIFCNLINPRILTI